MSSRLEQILEFNKNQRRMLVFGADAEALAKEITELSGRDVELIDFRNGACPSLLDRIPKIAEKGQIALIAIDASPSLRFHTLLTDLFYAMKPGKHLNSYAAKASVYVCTTARLLDQIEHWDSYRRVFNDELLPWIWEGHHNSPASASPPGSA
jgi:hypothetical protein